MDDFIAISFAEVLIALAIRARAPHALHVVTMRLPNTNGQFTSIYGPILMTFTLYFWLVTQFKGLRYE